MGACDGSGGGGGHLEVERDAVHHADLCDALEGHDEVAGEDVWLAEDTEGEEGFWGDVGFDKDEGNEEDYCRCQEGYGYWGCPWELVASGVEEEDYC